MADADSQAPVKVSQRKRVSIVPPVSPDPGLEHVPERNRGRGLDDPDGSGEGGEEDEGARLQLRRGQTKTSVTW